MQRRMIPQLFEILKSRSYSWDLFRRDLMAGLIVAILSLPMAISFAISSGARPEQGLYTAIIGGLVTAALGGSNFQISGPTGAFVALIFTVIQDYGYNGLVLATLMAGVLLILMGVFRLGRLIQYVPYPVVIGFTGGLAVTIFCGQVPNFLGLKVGFSGLSLWDKLLLFFQSASQFDLLTVMIGLLSLFIVILWRRVSSKVPGSLVAIIVSGLLVYFFELPLNTIGRQFGEISSSIQLLPALDISFTKLQQVLSPAIAIALLAAIESLLSAAVTDGMTETRHRPDIELIAQGTGNIFSMLFGGIPVTAGFARTAVNVKNGGKTPFASIFNGIFLLLIIFFCKGMIKHIPIASLAAIIFVVAYNMSEWRHFTRIFNSPKTDVGVLLTTFLLTVFCGLTMAIQVGVVLAVFLFAYNMSQVAYGKFLNEKTEEELKEDPYSIHLRSIPAEVEVFEVQGPFFFAAIEEFKTSLYRIGRQPKILIIRMRNVPMIDASGLRALNDVAEYAARLKICLVLSGVKPFMLACLKRSDLIPGKLAENQVFPDIDQALAFAHEKLTIMSLSGQTKPEVIKNCS